MTSQAGGFDDRARRLLYEAAEWRLIARLLECPSPAWGDDVEALSRELHVEALSDAARNARRQGFEGVYHSIFGPGGPAPPREASYHASVELGSLLSEIAGQYEAFGYLPETHEPPDHIAVEAGFIAYLRLKEAYAHATGDEEGAETARDAASRFTADHVAMIAHPLAASLVDSGVAYLAEVSALLAARVGPKPVTKRLPVVQPGACCEDDGGDLECDM